MNFIQKRIQAIREVRNWFYIRSVIKKNKNSKEWQKFGLRTGYVSQIYCVISLRKEDMGEEESLQKMRVVQRMEPINRFLEGLGLAEIIYPDIVKIEDSRSWLVIYWPMWEYFSTWRLFFQISGISLAAYYWEKYNLSDFVIQLINQL